MTKKPYTAEPDFVSQYGLEEDRAGYWHVKMPRNMPINLRVGNAKKELSATTGYTVQDVERSRYYDNAHAIAYRVASFEEDDEVTPAEGWTLTEELERVLAHAYGFMQTLGVENPVRLELLTESLKADPSGTYLVGVDAKDEVWKVSLSFDYANGDNVEGYEFVTLESASETWLFDSSDLED